jgi:hypothetical protein
MVARRVKTVKKGRKAEGGRGKDEKSEPPG